MSKVELKPCPFCGSNPVERMSKIDHNVYCGCWDEPNCAMAGWFTATEWNTRPIEDALHARISELSQAVGLITTLKPTMVMDANHPLDMAKEVAEYVTARIAELEEKQRWIPVSERLPETNKSVLILVNSAVFVSVRENDLFLVIGGNFQASRVSHWMPLPEPPIVYGKVCEE